MVDFKKRLQNAAPARPVHPKEIYDRLDRASDKGPLRPAQESVLEDWDLHRRTSQDVIFKLHTGEGKTLMGLLALQSKLNEGCSRALYLCPNNFLVQQTLAQAKQFGIRCAAVGENRDLPMEFLDGKALLVTSVQKLFNGLTKFGLGPASLQVDAVVMDDAHACIDAIKDACQIWLQRDHPAYESIVNLFAQDLEEQGVGTYAELRGPVSEVFLPVPYWGWYDRHREVAAILAQHRETGAIKFAWPILRDTLRDCLCVVSGSELVIAPYLAPLSMFGTFYYAKHRIYMSATVTDDSFFIKGLGLAPEVVQKPLIYDKQKWSGEKMVLIPSLIDDSLSDAEMVHAFGPSTSGRKTGVVVLTPSFESTKDWATSGAVVATKEDIDARVQQLREGDRSATLVVANRYDGIDLPDDSCRILILDGKPFGEALLDRYSESCRPGSEVIATRTARVIEQGLGRAVRGEKDYCVVILSGGDLVKAVRTTESRTYYSEQTRTQIELGIEISGMTAEEIAGGTSPMEAFRKVVLQCLRRDENWKEFYRERMDTIGDPGATPRMLDVFSAELAAERKYLSGDVDGAVRTLQTLLDNGRITDDADRGWYLQEIARYRYLPDPIESAKVQLAAYRKNPYLLKPKEGVSVSRLAPRSERRVTAIAEWVRRYADYQELSVAVDGILADLRFGVRADSFETALDELGRALGFGSERPDKVWKAGPDNLWALKQGEYLVMECKSEVEATRRQIHRNESGQLNNAAAWFEKEYPGANARYVMIIPAKVVGDGAGFNPHVEVLRAHGLNRFTQSVRAFFSGFRDLDLQDLSERKLQDMLSSRRLATSSILGDYTEPVKD